MSGSPRPKPGNSSPLGRRAVLKLGAALPIALWGGRAFGLGAKARVQLAQLRYAGGNATPRPTALARLAWEVEKRTSIDVAPEVAQVRVSDRALFAHPLLYLSGDAAFEPFPEADVARLQRFLIYGGTLLVDAADPHPGGPFDRSARQLVAALFPDRGLQAVKPQHTLHRSFYLLERAVGRVMTAPALEAVERDGRLVVIYSMNDLGGAWARDNFGQWEHGVYPGGERQRELAFRWGVNVVMYALCDDYKADQVHIPFILKRRKWQVK
ncbi:MAG: DUF4159 domain-containing protein [Deltaproteobacteria bacterium]|nr:DUF4159 domain-containing protein [Deltaproteobacteria bacterium]